MPTQANSPELETIFQSLSKTIADQVEKLRSNLSVAINNIAAMYPDEPQQPAQQFQQQQPQQTQTQPGTVAQINKKLPWFQHGIQGFLRKLWHGNSPQNPNWQGYKAEHNLTLQESNFLEKEIDNIVVELLPEATQPIPISSLNDVLNVFKRNLLRTIRMYINKARGIGQTQSTTNPVSPASPPQPPSPAPAPAQPTPLPPTAPEMATKGNDPTTFTPEDDVKNWINPKTKFINIADREKAIAYMKKTGKNPANGEDVLAVFGQFGLKKAMPLIRKRKRKVEATPEAGPLDLSSEKPFKPTPPRTPINVGNIEGEF